jgi:hypothetical protein
MPQDNQRRDGTEAARFEVNGGSIVDLAVDDRVHQTHDLRRQLGHGGRGHGVVVGTIVMLPEIQGSLVQIFYVVFRGFLIAVFGTHDISKIKC